jgi:nitrogen fixation protein NifU and related proteins
MDLDALYQDIILDHYRHPRNQGEVADAEVLADEENPNCGDRIRLTLTLKDGRVETLRYDCRGCAISVASASMMSEYALGKSAETARAGAGDFIRALRGELPFDDERFEDLAALQGVSQYPMRIKCATMCWHALLKALAARAG